MFLQKFRLENDINSMFGYIFKTTAKIEKNLDTV